MADLVVLFAVLAIVLGILSIFREVAVMDRD